MRHLCFALALSIGFSIGAPCAVAAAAAPVAAIPSFAEPAISPDRSEIAFVSGGDVWTVPAAGGEARLLVSHPANEARPVYSPDGGRLAFTSNRTGNGDVYVLDLTSGALSRLTFDDAYDGVDGWSRDGRWVYFSSTSRDVANMNDVWRVDATGGTPMQVSADRYVNEYFSSESPDGATLAVTARAIASAQWWRKGHSHIDEAEIWTVTPGATPVYEPVTHGGAKELWPMWGPGGASLYYVSDRSGAENVWTVARGAKAGAPRQVTKFTSGHVLWPTASPDGRTIVFERDFEIWSLDTASGDARRVPIALRGAPAAASVDHATITSGVREMALSPDGKKVAFVVRGEVFAASSTDGGSATRLTATPSAESEIVWMPNSRRLVYVSNRDGAGHLYAYDFDTTSETRLTNAAGADSEPRPSPDGKTIAFVRDGAELRAFDVATSTERVLTRALFNRPPFNSGHALAWSPDNAWVAYLAVQERLLTNAWVVPAAGGEARQVSFLANVGGDTISWSPDGTFLLFDTGQRTEASQLARVDLVPRTPKFREDQFRDLFREQQSPGTAPADRRLPEPARPATPTTTTPEPTTPATPAPASAPTTATPNPPPTTAAVPETKSAPITFEGIRRRLSTLPVGVDVGYQTISPDGKLALFVAAAAGQQSLYVYPLDELSKDPPVARQITATPGPKSSPQFSPDNKQVFFIDGGTIQVVSLDSRVQRPLPVAAEMDVNFDLEKTVVFAEGWTYLRDLFADPKYHGADWNAVRAAYEPHAAGARTPAELRRILSLMVGELNASHLGAGAPGSDAQDSTGRVGVRFDRLEYERTRALEITEIVPLGPADLARTIAVGDFIVAVDGRKIDAHANFDDLLAYKTGKRVTLSVAKSADGSGARDVAVQPVSRNVEKALVYRAWVEANRQYVARVSGGRLGYVHMYDMSDASLQQLYVDLDAENVGREGVVIDIRNNNGGFVNAYALDVFSRRPYLTMTGRGFPTATARTVLGQRSLERPTVLVTNQHSLSDAEDFSEGYRTMRLGPIVGEPTAGWIIYTSNVSLLDGTSFRIPFTEIRGADGKVMELNPRPVDVPVTRPVGEGLTGKDSQLDAAVRALLDQIRGR